MRNDEGGSCEQLAKELLELLAVIPQEDRKAIDNFNPVSAETDRIHHQEEQMYENIEPRFTGWCWRQWREPAENETGSGGDRSVSLYLTTETPAKKTQWQGTCRGKGGKLATVLASTDMLHTNARVPRGQES